MNNFPNTFRTDDARAFRHDNGYRTELDGDGNIDLKALNYFVKSNVIHDIHIHVYI